MVDRMTHEFQRRKINLIHAHLYTPFFYSGLARGWSANIPILFTEHGRHYPDNRKIKRVAVNKLLIRHYDRVTAVGKFIKAALIENEGIWESQIEVIYNGIDPKFSAWHCRWPAFIR